MKFLMTKTLYVVNLPWTATEEDLAKFFAPVACPKSVKIIYDRESGRSKGYGFVEFSSEEEASLITEKFNGRLMGNRILSIRERTTRPHDLSSAAVSKPYNGKNRYE